MVVSIAKPEIKISRVELKDGRWYAWGHIKNHPKLGDYGANEVHTSEILLADFDKGTLITRNTIYKIVKG